MFSNYARKMTTPLFVMLVLCITASALPQATRIINGVNASKGKYPWIANIGGCGGVMINSHVLLTAAHCLDYKEVPYTLEVMVGGSSLAHDHSEFYTASADSATVQYWGSLETDDKDIAIACLNEHIPGDNWPRLATGKNADYDDQGALIAGWGITEYDESSTGSNILMEAEVQIYNAQVVESYPSVREDFDPEFMILAGGIEGKDTCQGDSGGPMFLKENFEESPTVVGVTSWGIGCGDQPGVYASVPAAQQWILQAASSCALPLTMASQPQPERVFTPQCRALTSDNSTTFDSCSECQLACLQDEECSGVVFENPASETIIKRSQLPFWNCGDGRWPSDSTGLCTRLASGGVIDMAAEVDCRSCVELCTNDIEECEAVVYNYQLAHAHELEEVVVPTNARLQDLPDICSRSTRGA